MSDKARAAGGGKATRITEQLVRDALAYIPPNIDRDTWVRVGMAVKAEFGADGFAIWDGWSKGTDGYSANDARDTWRSIKAAGRVTVGTLFGLAKEHGFRFESSSSPAVDAAAIAAELARRELQRAKTRELEDAKYRERAAEAQRQAAKLWDTAGEQRIAGGYAERKGVGDHGVRYLIDGTLLVPLRDAAGALHNLQRIAPRKPADGSSDKRFLPGGRKTKLWHWCGDPASAPMLLLAEGYATAASVFEATGRPCAVAFDAGNLGHVARELRSLYSKRPLLICADDDQATEVKTGENTGRKKAAAVARAARGDDAPADVVLPAGHEPGTNADFNDMTQRAGSAAVAELIEQACKALQREPAREGPKSRAGASIGEALGQGTPPAPAGGPGQAEPDPHGFTSTERGVWHTARDSEGNPKRPQWLCGRLEVVALTRADDTNGWGKLLTFEDPDGNPKSWAMPAAMLAGDGAEWLGKLRDMGLRAATGTSVRNLIAKYIDTRSPGERVTCTDKVGWHPGPVFVLPSGCIGETEGRRYVFQSETGMEDTLRRLGTLAEWQSDVSMRCVGNSRLAFAVCCALAAPLLDLAGIESGIVSLTGASSGGKTTCMRVAVSVYGRPSYMQRWRTTSNALESIAVQYSDLLLALDEFGQLERHEAGQVAYLLANGMEKGRSTRSGLARRRRTWRTLVISTSEIGLADHMAEGGLRTRAGQEVRFLDVPADAGAGMGTLEALHGVESPAAFAEAIAANAARRYGSAGRGWLEWLCANHEAAKADVRRLVDEYRAALVPEAAAAQVGRAGTRFALIAAAGELASRASITGWPSGEALRAVRQCFNAWLGARGHTDDGEDAAMLRQVRNFLEAHGESRFSPYQRADRDDSHAPRTINRAGFRRPIDEQGKPITKREVGPIDADSAGPTRVEFLVLPGVFRTEICQGFDPDAVARLLRNRGHLACEGAGLQDRQRLPGVTGSDKVPCYRIKPSIFDDSL
jgi:putative DNA primase/helicase